jgi:uncharacterized repeat protein (TIGR01451 family)
VGDDLSFTLTVANAGPSEARRVVLTDTLPTGLTFVSATGAGWTWRRRRRRLRPRYAAGPGATAPPVTVTATVEASAYPSAVNTATVDGSTLDPDPTNNTATDTVNVPPLVNLAITKAHTGTPGRHPATYTLVVTNDGPTDDRARSRSPTRCRPGSRSSAAAGPAGPARRRARTSPAS